MGMPSEPASNAIIYVTYSVFLCLGTGLAWRMRNMGKADFLAGNGTQKGVPLSLNFIASAMGSAILFSYPQIGVVAGLQGVIVYALTSSLPLLVFSWFGPIIRKKCPEGFVLTEWTRQRYGVITSSYLSFLTLATLFLYMVSELSAIGQVVNALTGLDGLPALIVECVITAIYTSMGGFKISFITDNIQSVMICLLIIIATITIGVKTEIKPELIKETHLLDANLLGWQLVYMFPVAIVTNDFFLSNFWLRTFASKSDKDLWIGVIIATVVITIILTLCGMTGLIAVWSGTYDITDVDDSSVVFFMLLEQLPSWVVGIVLVMSVALSTAAFDSLQSAMVSSASNDLFRNRLNVWWIRAGVVIVCIPVVILAIKAPSILQIYLISDLLSAATIPVLVLGLSDYFWWWRGFEVVVGGLGGILTVWIFGTIYYGNAQDGANLLLLEEGLYTEDWGAFGAFVAAPLGGLLFGFLALAGRLSYQYMQAKRTGMPFDALTKPVWNEGQIRQVQEGESTGDADSDNVGLAKTTGKFF